jgi:CDP-4-dehydro-6-deoxyglucose reductase
MPWKWYDSTVIKIEDQSPVTKRFWVEIPKDEPLSFTAGQFVTMDLPISDKRLKRWRSYSIASAPNGNNVLEFCIVHMDGGAATEKPSVSRGLTELSFYPTLSSTTWF